MKYFFIILIVLATFSGSIRAKEPVIITADNISSIIQSLSINLPKTNLLPNSPFYFVKSTYENIRLYFAKTPEEKVELLYIFGRERLAEALQLVLHNQISAAQKTLALYSKYPQQIRDLTQNISETPFAKVSLPNLDLTNFQLKLIDLLTSEYNNSWRK